MTKLTAFILILALFILPVSARSAPIDQAIDKITDSIEKKAGESKSAQAEIETLKSNLELLISEYQDAHGKLAEINEATAKKERQLNSVVEQQIYYQNILNKLNVFTYRNGDTYFLEVVLGTSSFKDLIVKFDYLVKLNQRQADILQSTKRLRETVAAHRDELAIEKSRQQNMVDSLAQKQLDINAMLQRQQQLISSLDEDIGELQNEKKEKEKEKLALEAAAQIPTEFSGRINMIFPVAPGYAGNFINDWGFARAGNSSGHQGTDIFGLRGTPLVAVADGVISKEFGQLRIGGYRLHVIDDQGVDYYYAHLNNDSPGTDDGLGGARTAYAPGIGPGVRVTRGQVIGYLGDSGDAEPTPPHLHFGIRVNDQWINPYPHLKAAQL